MGHLLHGSGSYADWRIHLAAKNACLGADALDIDQHAGQDAQTREGAAVLTQRHHVICTRGIVIMCIARQRMLRIALVLGQVDRRWACNKLSDKHRAGAMH